MIGLMMALSLAAAPQDEPMTVDNLSYAETFTCAALGLMGAEYAREQLGDRRTSDDEALLALLDGLTQAAARRLPAVQARENLSEDQAAAIEADAMKEMSETDDEVLFAGIDLCAEIFGLNGGQA